MEKEVEVGEVAVVEEVVIVEEVVVVEEVVPEEVVVVEEGGISGKTYLVAVVAQETLGPIHGTENNTVMRIISAPM